MNLYAESSAVLAWLLEEPAGARVRQALMAGELIFASELTLIECDRVLIRALALKAIREQDATARQARLNRAAAHWNVIPIVSEVVERARRPFPAEPLRTLDAIHLASMLLVRSEFPEIALLSLDDRVRAAGFQMGVTILPS